MFHLQRGGWSDSLARELLLATPGSNNRYNIIKSTALNAMKVIILRVVVFITLRTLFS
jgi:hypothetical protein